jgi:hypothetical protein
MSDLNRGDAAENHIVRPWQDQSFEVIPLMQRGIFHG